MALCSPLAAAALEEGLSLLAEIRHVPMPHSVAWLDLGERPVLWIDPGSPLEVRCRVLLDVLRLLVLGPADAHDAHPIRHLRSVS